MADPTASSFPPPPPPPPPPQLSLFDDANIENSLNPDGRNDHLQNNNATPIRSSHDTTLPILPPFHPEETDDGEDSDDTSDLMKPLVSDNTTTPSTTDSPTHAAINDSGNTTTTNTTTSTSNSYSIRSRLRAPSTDNHSKRSKKNRRHRRRRQQTKHTTDSSSATSTKKYIFPTKVLYNCCDNDYTRDVVRSTLTVMHFLGRMLLWSSVFATAAGLVWYSNELKINGTDPHLIAWFSAGAFVLLGFPISIYGIVMHLLNYYQPNVQCYVVRILWMVPLYSIESWLCLRFHKYAIYIETLRDCYESYVLYNFLQFLIEILGGEHELILMLKDKSPTRGVHLKPLNWCIRPWLMGQPVSRRTSYLPMIPMTKSIRHGGATMDDDLIIGRESGRTKKMTPAKQRPVKDIQWTSPFFVQCKFGVLQYVLLKFVSSIITMILEIYGLYKEGDFTPRGGYLYICIVTNLSQCWALYCLAFFYYATKNELGPIRPVGKFLSVKAVVFFTWWQSFMIAIVSQMGLIPSYTDTDGKTELTSEDVAKGLQDYLICIEMFVGAIVHTFVFPHTDYLVPISGLGGGGGGRNGRMGIAGGREGKRIGRKGRPWNAALMHQYYRSADDRSTASKNSALTETTIDIELGTRGRRSSFNSIPSLGVEGGDQPPPQQVSPIKYGFDTMEDNGGNMPVLEEKDNGGSQKILLGDESIPANSMKRENKANENSIKDTHDAYEHEENSVHSSQASSTIDSMGDDDADDDDNSSSYRGRADSESSMPLTPVQRKQLQQQRTGFVRAFLDSTVPRDVVDGTVGIVKGDFNVEKKTLLHHAATSDEYDLFSKSSKRRRTKAVMAAAVASRVGRTPTRAVGNPTSSTVTSQAKSPKELA